MLRAVRHCHLPAKTKLSLFKKHYHPANDFQAVTIVKTPGHEGMLRWLLGGVWRGTASFDCRYLCVVLTDCRV